MMSYLNGIVEILSMQRMSHAKLENNCPIQYVAVCEIQVSKISDFSPIFYACFCMLIQKLLYFYFDLLKIGKLIKGLKAITASNLE